MEKDIGGFSMSGIDDSIEVLADSGNAVHSNFGLQRIVVKSPDDAFWAEFLAFIQSNFDYSGMRATQGVLNLLKCLRVDSIKNAELLFTNMVEDPNPYVRSGIGLNTALEIHTYPLFMYRLPDHIVERYDKFNVEFNPPGKMEKVASDIVYAKSLVRWKKV